MPTERFLNLPEEKRARVLRAAVAEMARVPFAEVSINRIVQAADIARGSFYQYFEDKNDLLEYIMAGYQAEVQDTVRQSLSRTGGDIFAAVGEVLDCVVAFATKTENYNFCYNVFSSAAPRGEERFAFLKVDPATMVREFAPLANTTGLADVSDGALVRLMQVLSVLMVAALLQVLQSPDQKERLKEDFERKLEIVKYGVLKREGC